VVWAGASDLPNTYTAQIRTVAFLGDHYQYELMVDRLEISVSSPVAVTGETVRIHIPPAACPIVEHPALTTTAPEVVAV
jgi:hypothetical protein